MKNKKLLVLGGRPMGSKEIVEYARGLGMYVIVADYLDKGKSPAKQLADECWEISTADTEELVENGRKAGIDGVVAGVHEFNIRQSIVVAQQLGLPSYCTLEQWDALSNKSEFKKICIRHGVPVVREYDYNDILEGRTTIDFDSTPLVCKPAEGSGSRGFSICRSLNDLRSAIEVARENGSGGEVLVEEWVHHESIVAYYNINENGPELVAVADKYPKKFPGTDVAISGLHVYPSRYTRDVSESIDKEIRTMLDRMKLNRGTVWIELFKTNEQIYANEAGYRFSGSLSYFQLKAQHGIDQLHDYLESAISDDISVVVGPDRGNESKGSEKFYYGILPMQLKKGTVTGIKAYDIVLSHPNVVAFPTLYGIGDEIGDWNSCKQTFGYLHFVFDNEEEMRATLSFARETLFVFDETERDMLYSLFDIDSDGVILRNS